MKKRTAAIPFCYSHGISGPIDVLALPKMAVDVTLAPLSLLSYGCSELWWTSERGFAKLRR